MAAEALKNSRTGKYFILLDQVGSHVRLINPNGEIVSLPEDLFSPDVEIIEEDSYEGRFSTAQVEAYAKHLLEQAKRDEESRKAASQARTAPRVERFEAAPAPRPRGSGPVKRSGSSSSLSSNAGRGLGSSWEGQRLCFFRPQIDRLGPLQTFKCIIQDVGTFVITKQEFQSVFAEVVLSPQYKSEGYFSYREIPEKARRFIKKD